MSKYLFIFLSCPLQLIHSFSHVTPFAQGTEFISSFKVDVTFPVI